MFTEHTILDGFFGAVLAVLAFFFKRQVTKVDQLEGKLSATEARLDASILEAAKTYASKSDIELLDSKIGHRFDKLEDKIDKVISGRFS